MTPTTKLSIKEERLLNGLRALNFNYDAEKVQISKDTLGWKVDKHHEHIADEPPGEPQDDGPFKRACAAVREYRFPDPRLITAVYTDGELKGRNMLLRAHFAALTFYFGVRIVAVYDEERVGDNGNKFKIWGYAYRTLKGHFEIGQIQFIVSKDLVTGAVYFEVDAYSKPDLIPNFFYRVGFHIFGRSLQQRFARTSLQRICEIANGQHA